ncbi:MAG: DUF1992 domain-containing protein [Nitratireductor sp.]
MNFARIAENLIEEAMRDGAFDNLPGVGKPLPPIPEGDFMEHFAARMMKEAGTLPPEVTLKKEIVADAKAANALPEGEEREKALKLLNEKRLKLSMMMERR